ncbi:hypothetical protein ACIBKZ_16260 [Streptomyces sp. NPDC050421]|uniref:hypothetical protein n=1 Tax=Streptomyces sp. NPDC050421 TaxID=3365613 RepID=UPI0037AA7388
MLTLIVLSWITLYSVTLTVSGSTGANLLLLTLLAALTLWARSHRNIVWHVQVAATDEARTQQLLDHLHQKASWMEHHCDKVVVIAHSQGGYLMHRVLASSSRQHPKVRRFIGVGSGLKPISLLKSFDSPTLRAPVWLATLCVPLLLWGVGPLTWQAFGPESHALLHLISATLHATVMPAALFSDPETMRLWLTGLADAVRQMVTAYTSSLRIDVAHAAAIAGGIFIITFARQLAAAAYRAQPSASLSLDHHRRNIEWREYTSPHDMVGRMASPEVPEGVDQPWISATGHAVVDHTLYFHRSGVLPRQLAADLLQDVSQGKHDGLRPAVDAWATAVARFDDARRLQAARRRMLHGLLVGLTTGLLLAPSLYQGYSILEVVLSRSVQLIIVLLLLAGLFSWLAHRSAIASGLDFSRRMSGAHDAGDKPWRVRIVPPALRTAPALAAGSGGLLALFGCAWFTKVALEYGDEHVWLGYPLLLPLAIGLPLLACAVAAGYPVRKRWPIILASIALLALLSPAARHTVGARWDLRAEVPLTLCIALSTLICLAGVLRAQRRATAQQ